MRSVAPRIIFTVTNDLTVDQRMHRICSTLVAEGWEVTLVGRRRPGSRPLDERSFQQRRLRILFGKGPLFYAFYNVRLFFYLLFHRADVLGSVDLDTLPAVRMAAVLKRIPYTFDAHEFFTEVPELQGRLSIQRIWTRIGKRGIPGAVTAYTVSASIALRLEQRYGRSFRVIRNLPLFREDLPAPVHPPYLLYQGALNRSRGLEELIDAIDGLPIELRLAGEGDLSEVLRRRAAARPGGKVRFLGLLPPSELRTQTAGALAGLNLLRPDGESYLLSLANKFFDYMMAGIPQICIDFEEYRRINDRYPMALLVPDLERDTLRSVIRQLMEDEALRTRLTAAAIEARKQLNWEVESEELVKIYRTLVD